MADHPICAPTIRARMKVFVSEFNRTRTISSAVSAYQVNNKRQHLCHLLGTVDVNINKTKGFIVINKCASAERSVETVRIIVIK